MTEPTTCEFCTSTFSIEYDESEDEDAPGYCPFCGEKIYFDEQDSTHDGELEELELDDMDT